MLGEQLPAAECLRWGVTTEVVANKDLLDTGRLHAERIFESAPLAVRARKRHAALMICRCRSGCGSPSSLSNGSTDRRVGRKGSVHSRRNANLCGGHVEMTARRDSIRCPRRTSRAVSMHLIAATLSVMPAAARAASPGAYPERAIRMIVPFPAGGGVDIVARIVAKEMSERMGQQVAVDDRAGASGIVGSELAAKAPPDGYTLLMGNVATHAVNVNLHKKLSYDPLKDFEPVSRIAEVPEVLLVHPSIPATSVKELIALARSKPGQLTYGSAGNGTPPHLAAELFKSMAKVNILHVPYKGTPPAIADLVGGQTTMIFSNIVTAMPLVNGGKLRALGVTSLKRSSVAPTIPTIAEGGLPGFQEYSWYGVLVPAGTPPAIISKLNFVIAEALKAPAVRDPLTKQGAEITPSTPAEFREFIVTEIARYGKIVKSSGLRVE
jgi:tripartite-type tricarboxylate transporter receptor subunit TctC